MTKERITGLAHTKRPIFKQPKGFCVEISHDNDRMEVLFEYLENLFTKEVKAVEIQSIKQL